MNEVELLFTEILNCERFSLYLDRGKILDRDVSSLISAVFRRRIQGEPLQYILGKAEFMGLQFKVRPDVFIPRPETEVLVETVIKKVQSTDYRVQSVNILEIGTGSGCIAVSLAKFLPEIKITASDISQSALNVARGNALLNDVAERIRFIESDLFTSYELRVTSYELIVSNPPYVATEEIKTLQPEISYEPRIALDGGRQGLDFYRRIINEAHIYLKKDGFMVLEISFNQKESVKNIFQISQKFEIIEVIKDYNDIDRVIVAKKI